eukprot:NODE_130_length_18488_cov_0.389961.p12 type:complete len:119 gc:universal NODE_130_length_18488_cov_0.389961:7703-7347(-)
MALILPAVKKPLTFCIITLPSGSLYSKLSNSISIALLFVICGTVMTSLNLFCLIISTCNLFRTACWISNRLLMLKHIATITSVATMTPSIPILKGLDVPIGQIARNQHLSGFLEPIEQ